MSATLAALLWAASATACFTEAPIDDGAPSTSEGGSCSIGALGCDCYGNGTCDAMLECAPETGTCIPAGCELGHADCLCDNESCVEPLLCISGICAAPSDSSGEDSSSGSASTTSHPTTTASSTTVSSSETGEPGSSSGESEESGETEGSSEATTEGPVECDALDCASCVACVAEPGQPCATEADACAGPPGCDEAASCMATCGVMGLCLDNCCEGVDGGAAALAEAFNECRADACATSCNDYQTAICNPF